MYARVARFEGGSADDIRRNMQRIGSEAGSGPPEGVPSNGFTMLADADGGRVLAIALFATEEDMRKGGEVLDAMSPPEGAMGKRASVEQYEVAVDVRV